MENMFESIKVVPNRSFSKCINGSRKKRLKVWLFHAKLQVASVFTAETEVRRHAI